MNSRVTRFGNIRKAASSTALARLFETTASVPAPIGGLGFFLFFTCRSVPKLALHSVVKVYKLNVLAIGK